MAALLTLMTLFVCIIILLHLHCKRKFNYWKSKGVPYKEPSFPLGNILNIVFSPNPIGLHISKLCAEFDGPYFGLYIFSRPCLLVKDPEILKSILVQDFHIFQNRVVIEDAPWDPIISNSIISVSADKWRQLRTRLSPIFSKAKLKLMFHQIMECGEDLEQFISAKVGENVEMKEVCCKFVTDAISSCIFGINTNSFKNQNSDIRKYGKMMFPDTIISSLKMAAFILAPAAVKMLKLSIMNEESFLFFKDIFSTVIKQRETTQTKRRDLIDLLIKNPYFNQCSNQDMVIAQAITLFSGAFEPTSNAIAFTLHEIGVNSEIQRKLKAEIATASQSGLTYTAIHKMKYLHMVICEALRKYPITPFIPREASEDYKINKTGLIIQKGTPIIIPYDALHKDPKNFPNPEVFNPERFSESNVHSINDCTYLPFGEGPRNCLGSRFALLITKVCIIYLLTKFQVHTNCNTTEPMEFSHSLFLSAKHGVNLTFTKQ